MNGQGELKGIGSKALSELFRFFGKSMKNIGVAQHIAYFESAVVLL